jgi:hypothetical protein
MDCVMRNGDAQAHGQTDAVLGSQTNRHKLIIDTDPGIGEFFSFFLFPVWLLRKCRKK